MSSDQEFDPGVPVATALCQYCEAPLPVGSEVCRSCRVPSTYSTTYEISNPYLSPIPVPEEIQRETRAASSIVSILLTGLLVLLLLGIGIESPGIAILLALLTIPPWIRTALVMRRRSKAGLETSRVASVSMFVGSVFVTWLILFIALISCFLTFCFACIGALTVSREESGVLMIAGFAALSVFFVIVAAFTPWIRHRFRRDSQKK